MSTITNTANAELELCGELVQITSNTVNLEVAEIIIRKYANCSFTIVGGTVRFCIEVSNPSAATINNVLIRDVLDPRLQYIPGTFFVNGVPATPTVVGNVLSYNIPAIPPFSTVVACFRVRVLAQ
jgi:uncharacterized repeat protein (TIGR01451 family)